MKVSAFTASKACSIGVEIELQIINPYTYDLISRSKDVLQNIKNILYPGAIKPELTQSIIELNTTIHDSIDSLLSELNTLKEFFVKQARELGIRFSGGGMHPFQKWQDGKIFPNERYKNIYEIYGYLAKQDIVFGQHIHMGCLSGDDAVYLTHMLARYLPHFIALSASSPFDQGTDTKFDSARVNSWIPFPTSGFMPYVETWKEFSKYFEKMRSFNVVETMKDFYWDIRPKPEFGTVELRICDTPLTIDNSVMLAAYAQTLAWYIFKARPYKITHELYTFYTVNRFQAARFGFEGNLIDVYGKKSLKIGEDILKTLALLKPFAEELGTTSDMEKISEMAKAKKNDARWIRETLVKAGSFEELVHEQSKLWMGD